MYGLVRVGIGVVVGVLGLGGERVSAAEKVEYGEQLFDADGLGVYEGEPVRSAGGVTLAKGELPVVLGEHDRLKEGAEELE